MNHVCHFSLHLIKRSEQTKSMNELRIQRSGSTSTSNHMVSMRISVVVLRFPNKYTDHACWLHLFVCPIYLVHWLCRTFFRFNAWELVGQVDELGVFIICSKHLARTCQSRASQNIWFKQQKPGGDQSELESNKTNELTIIINIYFWKGTSFNEQIQVALFCQAFLKTCRTIKTGPEKILYFEKSVYLWAPIPYLFIFFSLGLKYILFILCV